MNINAASFFSLIQSFDRFFIKRKLGALDKNITSIICTYAHSHDLWSDPLVETLACGSRTQGLENTYSVDQAVKAVIAGVTKTLDLGTPLKESLASGNGAKTLAWQAPFKKSPAS
ncbi:hypothetical protein Tco_0385685 [Tanacetum coccineum]